MLRLTGSLTVILLLTLLVHPVSGQDEAAEDFPLVWVSATDLMFAGSPSESGYTGVFHLAYKYSSDWILITADTAKFENGTVTYSNGYQYAFSQTGEKLSEMAFSTTIEAVDYENMEHASLGDDGSILTPFSGADIGFAVAQAESGKLGQISLARDANELNNNLHLYDGFLYQFNDDLSLKSQIAFSEISFGTSGLLRSTVEIPIETVEMPEIATSQPSIMEYTETPLAPPEDTTETPALPTLTVPEDYDVPPISKIGVIMVNDHANRPDLVRSATSELADILGDIEDLEVTRMDFDEAIWGGGILFERAVELGNEYSVDAFFITDLMDFDIPPDITRDATVTDVRITCEMEFAIVDCTGGRIFWRSEAEHTDYVNYRDFEDNEKGVVNSAVRATLKDGVKRMISDGVLAGGPIDKDWENED